MEPILILLVAFTVLTGCMNLNKDDLKESLEFKDADKIEASPCACAEIEFKPKLFDWVDKKNV